MNKNSVAKPTATSVTIVGEPRPGGTLDGAYLYKGSGDEAEEGRSVCRWYLNEEPGLKSELFSFPINETMVGKTLRFAVTPVSKTGVEGDEFYSPIIEIVRGYQNISESDSENSFIRQHGNFAMYNSGPTDRVVVATSAAFALTSGKVQSVIVKGRNDAGGVVPPEIAQYLKNNPATRMFSTAISFAAVVPTFNDMNYLFVWGGGVGVIPPGLNMSNIKSVYSNRSALAWIYDNPPPGVNTIGAVGAANAGGVVPDAIQSKLFFDKPRAIYSTLDAFVVLTQGNRVYAWGNPSSGGLIPAATQAVLNQIDITRIVCTASAVCVIGTERFGDPSIQTIATWGASNSGGSTDPGLIEEILDQDGVTDVVANRDSFVAMTKRRSKVVAWGGAHGGMMSEAAKQLSARGNIVMCASSAYAHCIVNKAGEMAAWGAISMGGTTPVSGNKSEKLIDAGKALEASGVKDRVRTLFKTLKVDDWYEQRLENGGVECDCQGANIARPRLSYLKTASGDIRISSNEVSFLLTSRGTSGETIDVIPWGLAGFGGDIPSATRQVLMASKIQKVYSTNGAYAVICQQGLVRGVLVTFGGTNAQQEAGQVPESLKPHLSSGIDEVYAISQLPPYTPSSTRSPAAFAARLSNGLLGVWGGNSLVTNEILNPST